jgi:hypothetical protein
MSISCILLIKKKSEVRFFWKIWFLIFEVTFWILPILSLLIISTFISTEGFSHSYHLSSSIAKSHTSIMQPWRWETKRLEICVSFWKSNQEMQLRRLTRNYITDLLRKCTADNSLTSGDQWSVISLCFIAEIRNCVAAACKRAVFHIAMEII